MTDPESTLPEGTPESMHTSDVRATDADARREEAPALVPGTKLEGTYEVKRLLGRGAMGAVYVVEHLGLGKEFAAKVVAGHRTVDGAAVARLRNEARITSSIEHENIVNVTHLGQTADGSVFIVMELLRGENLRERLVRQAASAGPRWLPDDEVDALARAVMSALAAAHAAGVVHRDLKPDNILLAEQRNGRRVPKIVDFGIGKLRKPDPRNDEMRITETGQIVGTPLYMAPEQMRSTADVDPRADLYSLGVILFELFTGRVPFEAHSLYDLAIKHATETPPDLGTLRPDLPAAVVDVVARALEKDVQARWPSADAMLAAWRSAWLRPTSPREAQPSPRAVDAAPSAPPTTGRTNTLRWAMAAVLAVGLIAAAASMTNSSPTQPAREGLIPRGSLLGAAPEPTAASITADPSPAPPTAIIEPMPGAAPERPPASDETEPVVATREHVIESDPTGASVLVAGEVVGVTPYTLVAQGDEVIDVELRARGRRRTHRSVGPTERSVVLVRLAPEHGAEEERDYPGLAPR